VARGFLSPDFQTHVVNTLPALRPRLFIISRASSRSFSLASATILSTLPLWCISRMIAKTFSSVSKRSSSVAERRIPLVLHTTSKGRKEHTISGRTKILETSTSSSSVWKSSQRSPFPTCHVNMNSSSRMNDCQNDLKSEARMLQGRDCWDLGHGQISSKDSIDSIRVRPLFHALIAIGSFISNTPCKQLCSSGFWKLEEGPTKFLLMEAKP